MTFTVLGASGAIGSRLRAHLVDVGLPVYAPSRGESGIFERPLGHVIYCVGLTADFRARPFDTVRAHVEVLRQVLECATYDSLLYLSSTRLYRGLETGAESAALLVRPDDPDDLYNASKLLGESLCLAAPNGETRVARISNVIGPGARSPSFALSLVQTALERGTIRLETHPESVKDYVDIRDVVELLPQLVEGTSRIYNVASGVQTTHRELAETLSSVTGARVVDVAEAPLQVFPPISTRRITEEFRFTPRQFRSSVEDMVAAERARTAERQTS